jgi:hypothetical protein
MALSQEAFDCACGLNLVDPSALANEPEGSMHGCAS